MIYLDSAATSYYRPPQVSEAVANAICNMGNGSRGTHPAALMASRVIFQTREALNHLFHGDGAEQVVFTGNVTESLNLTIKGLLNPGDQVITTVLEHNSVLRPLYEMERIGVKLQVVGCTEQGELDYGELEKKIRPGVRMVVCTHASNLTGDLVDIGRIGAMCRKAGVNFVVDAAQTAGIFPIDMKRQQIDVLCFTGHKSLMGPQGTGGLCVRKGLQIRPLISGGTGIKTFKKQQPDEMPEALEAGTRNTHGLAGLLAGAEYIRAQGMDSLRQKEQMLAFSFYLRVREIPGIRLYGAFQTQNRAPIVSLNLGNEDSGQISDYLAEHYGVYTRSGGHCAPLLHEHFGTEEQGMVRFSFSHFNTMEDVDTAVKALISW